MIWRLAKFGGIGLLALVTGWLAAAQNACTPTTPCVGLTFQYPSIPATAVILSCTAGTSCTQAALNAYIAQQTLTNVCPKVHSVWNCVAFKQTKNPQGYNFPGVQMGNQVNFSFEWLTPAGPIQQTTVAQVQ